MENNIKLVVKDKPKVTYKEVKRKMKKLTLTQKSRIKEDKKEQKSKEKAEKQRVTQRVKININIPSSVNKSGQPVFNPLNQSSREQISLLNSINEQLKNKNKPASINDMFKIPVKRTIETQTDSPVNHVIETQTEPIQVFNQGSQAKVKQREQSSQQEPSQTYSQGTETQTQNEDEDFSQGMEDINNELKQRLAGLPSQFSPKVETPIPIIREASIPIISKPEETSNENIIEKVTKKARPKMTDEEKKQRAEERAAERAKEKEVERQIDEQEAILEEEAKQQKKALAEETGMQRRAREKSQVEDQFQIDLKGASKGLAEEMALRKVMNDSEIANTPAMIRKIQLDELLTKQQSLRQQVEDERNRLKALKEQNEKDREIRRKNYEEYQVLEKQKVLNEKVGKDIRKRVQPTGENVGAKVKEIEARKTSEQAQINKVVEAEYNKNIKQINETRGVNYAYNVLIDNLNDREEIFKLTEAYNNGFLKKADIKKKLMDLRTDGAKPKKVYSAKQVDEFFDRYKNK